MATVGWLGQVEALAEVDFLKVETGDRTVMGFVTHTWSAYILYSSWIFTAKMSSAWKLKEEQYLISFSDKHDYKLSGLLRSTEIALIT